MDLNLNLKNTSKNRELDSIKRCWKINHSNLRSLDS